MLDALRHGGHDGALLGLASAMLTCQVFLVEAYYFGAPNFLKSHDFRIEFIDHIPKFEDSVYHLKQAAVVVTGRRNGHCWRDDWNGCSNRKSYD
jgi:hypothetical protein